MFKFAHNNFNVLNLDKSLKFYQQALGLKEVRRYDASDFTIVYLGDNNVTSHLLELTWIKDRKTPYDLGDNEFHLAVYSTNFTADHKKHQEMGCICFENQAMGIYFINDPDGYWIEVLPE